MTIASICTHLLKHKLATACESASMRLDRSRCVLVEVICDYGIPDVDACVGPDRETTIETDANCLVCQTALETSKIWTPFHNSWHHKGPTIMARDCNDIAPWDIERRHFRVKISSYAGRPRQLAKTYGSGRINKNSFGWPGDHASKMAGHEIDRFEGPAVLEYLGTNRSVRAGQPIVIGGRKIWRTRRHISEPIKTRSVTLIQPDLCGTAPFQKPLRISHSRRLPEFVPFRLSGARRSTLSSPFSPCSPNTTAVSIPSWNVTRTIIRSDRKWPTSRVAMRVPSRCPTVQVSASDIDLATRKEFRMKDA